MSVRAYRVNKIDHELCESFNLWHDQDIMEYVERSGLLESLNMEANGLVWFEPCQIKDIIKIVSKRKVTKEYPARCKADDVRILKADLKKAEPECGIYYYCF